jgi:hypothetical protein
MNGLDGKRSGCGPAPGNTTCSSVNAERGDGVISFMVTICTGSDPLDIGFPGEQEVDAVVRTRAGAEVWRWSRGQTFDENAAHVVHLGTQECSLWRVPWDYVDDSGRRVPKGTYMIGMPVLSSPRHDMGSSFTVE